MRSRVGQAHWQPLRLFMNVQALVGRAPALRDRNPPSANSWCLDSQGPFMTTFIFGNTATSTRQSARQNTALLLGSVALGVVLIAHGWQKFFTFGIAGATASFEQMGLPLAGAAAI